MTTHDWADIKRRTLVVSRKELLNILQSHSNAQEASDTVFSRFEAGDELSSLERMERTKQKIANAHKILALARQLDDFEAASLMEDRIESFERMLRNDTA